MTQRCIWLLKTLNLEAIRGIIIHLYTRSLPFSSKILSIDINLISLILRVFCLKKLHFDVRYVSIVWSLDIYEDFHRKITIISKKWGTPTRPGAFSSLKLPECQKNCGQVFSNEVFFIWNVPRILNGTELRNTLKVHELFQIKNTYSKNACPPFFWYLGSFKE